MPDAHLRQKPERMPMHWAYFLLYELGLVSGLWLHGDSRLTLALMLLTIPLACVVYIPYRWFNEDFRQLSHYLMAAAALAWAIYRFVQHPPVDILLIEMFSIMGLSFAFTNHRRGYYYMLMIGIVLALYGSVVPPRELYVYMMPLAFLLAMLLLYQTRPAALANDPELSTYRAANRYNLPWMIVHALGVIFVWVLLVVVFPAPNWQSPGFIPVSQLHNNLSLAPPRLDTWFSSRRHAPDRRGNRYRQLREPTDLSSQASMRIQTDVWVPSMDGEGGGPPGEDLVMRVQSPLKLYWLGRLYDVYDGTSWQVTPILQRQHMRSMDMPESALKTVRQRFIIDKWISRQLFSGYLRTGPLVLSSADVQLKYGFGTVRIAQEDAQLPIPFSYEVRSLVDLHLKPSESSEGLIGWYEVRPPSDYLQLPQKEISARLKHEVELLVEGKTLPLEKAYALRDYFRDNFTYSLSTPTPPEGREAVDYFVFELREGHCEYFASSLAVMARLAGLPARVATGFSPGNFNVLTGMFEVFEYHAHAWTQIFVEGAGWLTMDGTPPGSMPNRSRTSPAVIGNLRDPFSDEWRIRSPELSKETLSYLRQQVALSRAGSESANQAQERAANTANEQTAESPTAAGNAEVLRAQIERERQIRRENASENMFNMFGANFVGLLKRLGHAALSVGNQLLRLIFNWNAILILTGFLVIRLIYPYWRRSRHHNRRLRTCERWYLDAERLAPVDPAESIARGFNAARLMLEMGGYHKENRQDLDEYTRLTVARELQTPAAAIFNIYIKISYRPAQPTVADAKRVCQGLTVIRAILLPRLQKPPDRDTSIDMTPLVRH